MLFLPLCSGMHRLSNPCMCYYVYIPSGLTIYVIKCCYNLGMRSLLCWSGLPREGGKRGSLPWAPIVRGTTDVLQGGPKSLICPGSQKDSRQPCLGYSLKQVLRNAVKAWETHLRATESFAPRMNVTTSKIVEMQTYLSLLLKKLEAFSG